MLLLLLWAEKVDMATDQIQAVCGNTALALARHCAMLWVLECRVGFSAGHRKMTRPLADFLIEICILQVVC